MSKVLQIFLKTLVNPESPYRTYRHVAIFFSIKFARVTDILI